MHVKMARELQRSGVGTCLHNGTGCVIHQDNPFDHAVTQQVQEAGIRNLLAANRWKNVGIVGRVLDLGPQLRQLLELEVF